METNDKKPKRPRIGARPVSSDSEMRRDDLNTPTPSSYGQRPALADESQDQSTDRRSYNPNFAPRPRQNYQPRPYQPRPYQNNNRQQGGYQPRYNQNGADMQGGYRPYARRNEPMGQEGAPQTEGTEQTAEGQTQYRPYQPRYNNNRQQGYNQNRQHNGYNNQNRQGGYNNNRQGGYNNQNRQGGYNNQNRQGGYNNQNRQGGYNNQNRQGGYNNQNRQGGYNNQNRQGGYKKNNGPRQNQYGMPQGGRSFTPRPKPVEYEQPIIDPNEEIRLNKYMANAGLCSRREADEFIQQGLVKVNGEVVTELGTKITHSDVVEYDEKVVTLERKTYILLNKPKDCVTTSDDPNGRLTVMDLVKGACNERIYPVGRLDRNTTGVLLLTNDGDLASKLTHPKFVKKKIYHVWTDKDIAEDDMQRIADGIELEDGPIHADAISYATETDRNQAGIEIHSGRNRIVRRIFESLGYHVTKLDRVYFAGLTKKNLPRGRWRYLTQEEVNYLKMGSFE